MSADPTRPEHSALRGDTQLELFDAGLQLRSSPGTWVDLGPRRLPYTLTRARRSSIGFAIGPEGLRVRAPRWVAQSDIEALLRSKAEWILRKWQEHQRRAAQIEALRIVWQDGALLPYLGGQLRLRERRVAGERRPTLERLEATLAGECDELWLALPASAEPAQWRDLVQAWLQRQARAHFEPRLAHFAARLGVEVARLRLSSAQGRWGSASSRGVISLNWRLIHFSPAVIDYVVAHEVAHLREMNHGAAFWALVGELLPGFEAQRDWLKAAHLPPL